MRDAARPKDVPIDSYELIEGIVTDAAEVNRRIYLNFGDDWTSDVTAIVAPEDRAVFRDEHVDLLALVGHRVRVRGWTGWRNGPSVSCVDPDQIEVLD